MASEGELHEIDREVVAARAALARARAAAHALRYVRAREPVVGLRDALEAERAAEERFRRARIRSYLAGVAPLAPR